MRFRTVVASQYLAGSGIEIGPLHRPMALPRQAQVQYVDLMTAEDAYKTYPELRDYKLCPIHIVDDGQVLSTIPDGSLDFIIANHMLEHSPNPLKTLEIWLGKLKQHGVIFFALPNKEYSFDSQRPITSLTHLMRDYEEGPEWSKVQHFEEWGRLAHPVPEDELAATVSKWIAEDHSIHYHVWTPEAFVDVLRHCQTALQWDFQIELVARNQDEFVNVIRKGA